MKISPDILIYTDGSSREIQVQGVMELLFKTLVTSEAKSFLKDLEKQQITGWSYLRSLEAYKTN